MDRLVEYQGRFDADLDEFVDDLTKRGDRAIGGC
jgi:hypothetical protein